MYLVLAVYCSSSSQAIVFRPFKGEVLDAVVTQVNKVSLFQLTSVVLYPSPAYTSVAVCTQYFRRSLVHITSQVYVYVLTCDILLLCDNVCPIVCFL